MKLTKELKYKIDLFFEDKTEEELEYIFKKYKPKKKKVTVETIEEGWIDFKEQKPVKDAYYKTKVKGTEEIIVDYWWAVSFAYNDNIITHWREK